MELTEEVLTSFADELVKISGLGSMLGKGMEYIGGGITNAIRPLAGMSAKGSATAMATKGGFADAAAMRTAMKANAGAVPRAPFVPGTAPGPSLRSSIITPEMRQAGQEAATKFRRNVGIGATALGGAGLIGGGYMMGGGSGRQ
jgi:hypothetical protein